MVNNQQTTIPINETHTVDDQELLPLSDTKKKKKQQEGKARIDELRKKRIQSGLKVAEPVVEEESVVAETTTPSPQVASTTIKTLIVTPGKIGLSLTVNKTRGGATVTKVDPTCRYQGLIHVDDIIMAIDGRLIQSVDDMHYNANKIRTFEIISVTRGVEAGAPATTSCVDPPPFPEAVAATTSKTAVDPPPSSTSSKDNTATMTKQRKMPPAVANIFSPKINTTATKNNNNAHRPDANAKYNPNQPFPTQGYKMSTAAYCGCGPTPSNKNNCSAPAPVDLNSTATKVARSGSGTLQQLRQSMRNLPSVKRASLDIGGDKDDEDDDQKMPARPSPPGKVGSTLDNINTAAAEPPVNEAPEKNHNNTGVLKASISRAQQLVSSVAFANRERRGKLGIKSDLNNLSAPHVSAGSRKEMTSPSVDPPSSSVTVAETKVEEETRVEESTLVEADEEEIPHVSPFTKVVKGIIMLLKWASILPLAFGVIYILVSLRGEAPSDQIDSSAAADNNVSPACFIDYPSDFYFSDENVTGDDGCGGIYVQCPQWGRCHGGLLRDCNDAGGEWQGLVRFVPSEKGTSCVPSDGALEIMGVVQNALVNMTVSQSCRSSDMITDPTSVLLKEQEPYPLFSLDVVSWRVNRASEIDITMSASLLLWLEPVFDAAIVTFGQVSDVDDPPNAMGLSSEVPEHKLPIPFSCQMKFMFIELFGWILKFLYRTVVLLAQKLWQYISTHPKSSPVALMMLVGVVSIRRKKKHRAKVREIFDVVKEEAYDRLAHCDGSGGYAALHLRDDVGHAMYPSNVRERLFMYNYVWPRVIIEVRADNRVRKFRKAADGKQLEHWDLNTNSKRGWQLRKTPNKTPDKSIETTSSAKRDP